MHSYPTKSSEPNTHELKVSLAGAGTSAPTKTYGNGVTVTRTAEGVLRLTFDDHLGPFVGIPGFLFGATTPGDVKGHTLTRGAYNTAGHYVEVSIWDSSFAADDIDSGETLDLTCVFKLGSAV